jgi:hypothetical protein
MNNNERPNYLDVFSRSCGIALKRNLTYDVLSTKEKRSHTRYNSKCYEIEFYTEKKDMPNALKNNPNLKEITSEMAIRTHKGKNKRPKCYIKINSGEIELIKTQRQYFCI